jgi:hypothetical protein
MAAKKKLFNIPSVEDLEEGKTSNVSSKTAFQLFRKTTDINKSNDEIASTSNDQTSVLKSNSEPRKRLLKVSLSLLENQNPRSTSTNLDLKRQDVERENTSSNSLNEDMSRGCTSTRPSSSTSTTHTLNSVCGTEPSETAVHYSTLRNTESNVGKSFKDTFAFLKNTRHYEEAEAKMKEIE